MTTLSTAPLDADQLDLFDCITDHETPLGSLRRQDFEDACRAVADIDGYVNPNDVSAYLHRRFGEINPNSYSAQWAPACGRNGFMDKTGIAVQIDPKHSKGNGNKDVFYRKLRAA